MNGMSWEGKNCFFFANGYCLPSDVSDILGGIAADENPLGVTQVTGFGDEFMNIRIVYGAELFIVLFA
jgi:hypothetical protein